MTLNVRIGGPLADHVSENIGEHGRYENVSEYVRDLIRRDLGRVEEGKFQALKAELQRAFATPLSDYRESTPEDVFVRAVARDAR